jgi:hypothetical protein
MDWDSELRGILEHVAAITQSGLGAAERKVIMGEVIDRQSKRYLGRERRPLSLSYSLAMQFHGHDVPLRLQVESVSMGYLDVRFSSPDVELMTGVRQALRAAHLAWLIPFGRAQLSVEEALGWKTRPPMPYLWFKSDRQFGCLGFGIEQRVELHGDTLAIHADGIVPPMDVCPTAMGPAISWWAHALVPGQYLVMVDYRGDSSTFVLAVTDSSLALATRRSTFIHADERVRWRVPTRSFWLSCYPGGDEAAMCNDLHRWAASHAGIDRVAMGSGGISPYPEGPDGAVVEVYRFRDGQTLDAMRACIQSVGPQIREAVGIAVHMTTWMGERIVVGSMRSFDQPHIARPSSLTQSAECRQP